MSTDNIQTELMQGVKILQNRLNSDQRVLDALVNADEEIRKLRQADLSFWLKRKSEQLLYIAKLEKREQTEQVKLYMSSAVGVLNYIDLKIQNIQ